MRQIITLHLWNRNSTLLARSLRISEHLPSGQPDVHLSLPWEGWEQSCLCLLFPPGRPHAQRIQMIHLLLESLISLSLSLSAGFFPRAFAHSPGSPILKICNLFSLLPCMTKVPGKMPHSSSGHISIYLSLLLLLQLGLSPITPSRQLSLMSPLTATSLELACYSSLGSFGQFSGG